MPEIPLMQPIPLWAPMHTGRCSCQAGNDPRIDVQVLIQLLHHFKAVALGLGVDSVKEITPYRELSIAMRDAMDSTGKPTILVMPEFKQGQDSLDITDLIREARQVFLERGIPVFSDLGNALTGAEPCFKICAVS